MAQVRKKTGQKRNVEKNPEPIKLRYHDIVNNEKLRFFTGIFLLFFAVLLAISFFSFLFTWKQDQDVLDLSWYKYLFNTDITVENTAGKIGLLMSHIFIYNLFGLSSFIFIFIFVILGFKMLNIKTFLIGRTFKKFVFVIIWLSITLSFIFGKAYLFVGGGFGYVVSNWFSSIFGSIGTGFVIFLVLLAFLILTVDGFLSKLKKIFEKGLNLKKLNIIKKISNKKQKIEKQKVEKKDIDKEKIDKVDKKDIDKEKIDKVEKKDVYKEKIDEVDKKDINNIDKDKSLKVYEKINYVNKKNENSVNVINTEKLDSKQQAPISLEVNKNNDIISKKENNSILTNYDPTLDLSNYKVPPLELLNQYKSNKNDINEEELLRNKDKIIETLRHYKIEIKKIKATIGPTITLYEIIPAPGIRISKIRNLEDDIALSLAAFGIRIIAPMPGRGTIGIEVPNEKPEIVSMYSVIKSVEFQNAKMELPIALGKTVSNESFVFDLVKMPHVLVAGATGQGKSVGLNVIIASILYKKHPSQVKFVLVDPKKVELILYDRIEKHFLACLPKEEEAIVTDNKKVIRTVNALNEEMDNRYKLLKKAKARTIKEYNAKFLKRLLNPENGHKFIPYIVLIIDEFADLIMTAGKEIEKPIARLAQLARAIGIHLIVATQRPSTNIITGTIKANFPARVAFRVASMIDSRTILDSSGANQLIGRGDMLMTRGNEMIRLQCAFIDTPELDKITQYIEKQQSYNTPFYLPEPEDEDNDEPQKVDLSKRDEKFEEAARIVVTHQKGSTSLIQRKLSLGYNRAGRIIDQLEEAGIVGPPKGSKARDVYYVDEYSLEQLINSLP